MPEVLAGTLEHVSLASVLQLAEGESFDGWIHIGSSAIGLADGAVKTVRHHDLEGREALRELFLLRRGRFVLDQGKPAAGASLGHTMGLVMDGCRIADEWHRLAAMVLEVVELGDGPLSADARAVIDQFDGERCVLEAVEAVGCRGSAIVDDLLMLLEEARLAEVADRKLEWAEARLDEVARTATPGPPAAEAQEPPPTQTPPPTPEPTPSAPPEPAMDFYEALEAGRQALKRRDFDSAEGAFKLALRSRPGDRVATQNLRRVRQMKDAAL